MSEAVRIAVLGCGEVAREHHLPWLARMPEAKVAVLADPAPDALGRARRLAPEAQSAADWQEALAASDVDAVIVCLPNRLHAEAAEAAAERGLHLYVEKPLATTFEDAERIRDACRRAGVVAAVGFNYRFNALYARARADLGDGRIGRVAYCRSAFTLARNELPAWKRSRDDGGGVLFDLAPHHLDLLTWLLDDEVADVHAATSPHASGGDAVVLTVRLRSGCCAQLAFAYGTVDEERFELVGAGGRIVVDRRRHQGALVELAGEGRLRRTLRSARDLGNIRYVLEKRSAPGGEPSHGTALRQFLAAVRDGRPADPDLDAGVACAAVVDAAERSLSSGRWEAAAPDRLVL